MSESNSEPDIFTLPRYKDDPEILFIDLFVTDTISPLRDVFVEWIADRLRCDKAQWRNVVREASKLSGTFETAILDLWYRNSEIARSQGIDMTPLEFSRMFTDNYFSDGSQIDVWGPGALEAAISRVEAARALERKM